MWHQQCLNLLMFIVLKRLKGYETFITSSAATQTNTIVKVECVCVCVNVCTHAEVQSPCVSAVLSKFGETAFSQSSALHHAVYTEH